MIATATKTRERMLARVTLALLAGALVYVLLLGPQIEKHGRLKDKERTLERDYAQMKRDMLVKDGIERTYKTIEPLIRSVGHDQQEISLLTRELNDLYSPMKVRIGSVKILPVTRNPYYRQFAVKIDMSGDIRDVLTFLRAVESSRKPIKVEKLTFAAKDVADQVAASFVITKIVTGSAGTPPRTRKDG